MTERVDEVWGADMTKAIATAEGRACVLIAAGPCSGELVGHPCRIRRQPPGGAGADRAGRGEALRSARGGCRGGPLVLWAWCCAMTTAQVACRTTSSARSSASARPARPPSSASRRATAWPSARSGLCNGQLLRVRHLATVEELRPALAGLATLHKASRPRERHGHETPDQTRAEQIGLEAEAATGIKPAA